MSDYLHNVLFSYYPYLALTVFFVGSIYRYETDQYSWKSSSSQLLRKDYLFWASNLFHLGIIFLFFGHFFGLLTPKGVYSYFITPEKKQIVAMYSGGVAGLFCLVGLVMLLYRRFIDSRVRSLSNISDVLILFLLLIQLLLGLFTTFVTCSHLDNSNSMIALANWAQGVIVFSPNLSEFIVSEHYLFKLHLFFGMTLFLVFPFTRLVHIFSFPYLYILREGFLIVRKLK